MNDVIGRVYSFEKQVFPNARALYSKLTTDGQSPKILIIGCSDSRVVPEHILQAEAGDLFVCRNAGNIVPPFSNVNGGVSSTVEYAVAALGVSDIIVCGHSDCGAMKALMNPELVKDLPSVSAWLSNSHAARSVVHGSYPDLDELSTVRAAALENVVVQIAHLRTHPSVAAKIARGEVALHGWFVDIHEGVILALDGDSGRFMPLREDRPMPVALPASQRIAGDYIAEAAE